MSTDIKYQVYYIQSKVKEFGELAQCSLPPIAHSIDYAQKTHQNLFSSFQDIQERINFLKTQFAGKYDYSDNIDPEFFLLTDCASDLEGTMTKVNDTVVQYFPHAKIQYGPSCADFRENWTFEEMKKTSFKELSNQYGSRRKIRGDGNCFFTALTTAYFENIYQNKLVEVAANRLMNDEFEIPGKDEMLETLFSLSTVSSFDELEKILSDNQKILPFVHYFRKKTSRYMQAQENHFKKSIIEMPFKDYCKNVEKMGENADDVAIAAACLALDFPIFMLDIKQQIVKTDQFCQNKSPIATLCRDGEHYFILYKDTVKKLEQSKPKPQASLEDQFIDLVNSLSENNKQKTLDLFFTKLPSNVQEKIKNQIWKDNGEPRDKGEDFAGDLIRANPFDPKVTVTLTHIVFSHLTEYFEQTLKAKPSEAHVLFYRLPHELRETMKKGFWLFEGMPQGDSDFGNTFFNQSPQDPTVFKTLQVLQQNRGSLISLACRKELEILQNDLHVKSDKEVIETFFQKSSIETQELMKKSIWVAQGKPLNKGHDFAGDFFRAHPQDQLIKEIVAQLLKNI